MDKLKNNEYVLRVGSYDSCELYPYFLLQEYADLKAELERTKAQLQTQQTWVHHSDSSSLEKSLINYQKMVDIMKPSNQQCLTFMVYIDV